MNTVYKINATLLFLLVLFLSLTTVNIMFFIVLSIVEMLIPIALLGILIYFISILSWKFLKIWTTNSRNKKTDTALYVSLFWTFVIIGVFTWIVLMCWYLQWNNHCGWFEGIIFAFYWGIPYILAQVISAVMILKKQ